MYQRENKLQTLVDIFRNFHIGKAVIFVNNRQTVDFLTEQLRSQHFQVASPLYSGLIGKEKCVMNEMKIFRLGKNRILYSKFLC